LKNTNNIIEILKKNAETRPNDILYRYIEDEEKEPLTLTYDQVHYEAKKIASNLLSTCRKGDRALMLYPAGLEFITAFLGCLYAGLIAVPAYPPRKNQKLNRLKSIINDAEATVVMTSKKASEIAKPLFKHDEGLKDIYWLVTDSSDLNEPDNIELNIESDDIAFLQYTSGSTGNPKGVMVSHANVMSNMEVIYQSCGHNEKSKLGSWLPHFHDMGLMGGVLQPLYGGLEITFMAPSYFLQKPIRWLKMMSDYKTTSTAGPNFAYDLCVEKIKDEDLEGLDLSHMILALNGAEPVNNDTLIKFSEKFAKCGFKSKVHFPSYGMAETTLMLTAGDFDKEAKVLTIDSVDLQSGVITALNKPDVGTQDLVSSGRPWLDHEVIIVDTDTFNTVENDRVGEVWVRGSSITQGYWKNPLKTAEDFNAYTNDTKQGPYLRTGDLGFLDDGELFICGRAKDLLIIRGKNYFPQDIEMVISFASESLSQGNTAAFSIDIDGREHLVIAQEVKRTAMRNFDKDAIFDNMKETIGMHCELQIHDIVLLRPGQILKTSSGKIQRQANRKAYLENEFKTLARYLEDDEETKDSTCRNKEVIEPKQDSSTKEKYSQISLWLKNELSALTKTPKDRIKEDKNLMSFGLDSLASVELQDKISETYGIEIELVSFYDYPTIKELAPYINELIKTTKSTTKKAKIPPIVPLHDNKFEKFQLNDIQQAYLLGRNPDMILGNTPCFAYAELNSPNVNLDKLEKAWNLLVQRHEMLRCFMNKDITQQIIETVSYQKILPIDLTHLNEEEIKEHLLIAREKKTSDIPNPCALPLVNIDVYLLPNGIKKLHMYVDMLVCDASSMFILLKDLQHFYNFPDTPLEKLDISFKDYLHYEEEHKDGEHYTKSLNYWRARLETLPSGPELALETQPVEIKKPHFTRRTFKLNASAWKRFQSIAANLNATPTAVLLSLYAKVLATWSNGPNFCINLTHFHRIQAHKDVNSLIGDFTSLIPLEVNIPAKKEFLVYLKEVQSQLLHDLEHDEMSGIQILREMRSIGRESSMPVVFTSTLGLNDFACDWLGEREFTISQTPQVWIDNQVMQKGNDLIINWDCIEGLFKDKMLDSMFGIYTDLIEAVLKNTDLVKIERYSAVVGRQDALYVGYNKTEQELPTQVLPQQCMDTALIFPDKEAIITSEKRITYKEFHNACSQIATILEKKEFKENEHIAIILSKGWEQIVSVIACGYAGVAYLPMSIDYPKNRIEYLLDEADITTVLADEETIKNLGLPSSIRTIDVKREIDFTKNMPRYDIKAELQNLAYTIFTSGSTGKPKGVMITHKSVCNTVMDINSRFNVNKDDKFFAISALNFDLSVYDVYGALSTGASLAIPDEDKRKDASDWYNWIKKEKITIWNSVPALMKLVCEEANYEKVDLPKTLRLVMLSGDFIPMSLYKDLNKITPDSTQLISLGGATEASIWSIYFNMKDLDKDSEKIPYGYPLANQEIYILDDALDSKPYLVHGDIYIKGKGIAQGYFNDPKRTKNQFITDPHNDETLYKTGDIGYFNPKGYIEIVGRDDEQVKIQGYRIELGEIEQRLLETPMVKEAVVLVKSDDNHHNVLIAYITTQNNIKIDNEELKQNLSMHLPEYMIPLVITSLDTMPLTTNGKVDKKTLSQLEVEIQLNHDFVAPRDEVEENLSRIFAEILKVEKVGIYDNFFELGGHSLLATQLVSKIRNEMETDISLKMLFHCSNISDLQRAFRTDGIKQQSIIPIATQEVIEDEEEMEEFEL